MTRQAADAGMMHSSSILDGDTAFNSTELGQAHRSDVAKRSLTLNLQSNLIKYDELC